MRVIAKLKVGVGMTLGAVIAVAVVVMFAGPHAATATASVRA
jgi:hypothetical protein